MAKPKVLRAVLIGGRELGEIEASGKSSVGNTILGKEVFPTDRRTARCQKVKGHVFGWNVTLVDTPGWWWHYFVENTPMFDRLEIIQSPSLCSPGPHIFLLVLPVTLVFPNEYKTALEEQLQVFGEQIWNHMIVVFSAVTPVNLLAFKQHLKKWPDLHWVIKKCLNRYHFLDIKNKDDGSQVQTLLSKIDEMVTRENGHFLKFNATVYLKRNEKSKEAQDKAHQRLLEIKRQRDEQRSRMQKETCLADIRLVVVGASWAARSSAANIILGRNAFNVGEERTTVRCEVEHCVIDERTVTVVDTPGWFWFSPISKTSETDKLEIRHSVNLCPPGPHAFLLTVPIATAFNNSYKKAIEEHMNLFGENVWSYTIVLFTRGDWLGDTTIEERIETEEPYLDWLMKKCGNRYHVLKCKDLSDLTQRTELIEKIDEMVAGNGGGYYQMNDTELNEKLRDIQNSAKINSINVKMQRKILQEVFKGHDCRLTELRLVLLGKQKSGKSTSGNIILFKKTFQSYEIESYQHRSTTEHSSMKQRAFNKYLISIVDTPGWSSPALENIKEVLNSVSLCPPGPHAFLLVLSAREPFTNEDKEAVEKLMKQFGENVWRHTLLLFSHGDWLRDRPIEEYIESEGDALKWLVDKCEKRYHMLTNSRDTAQVEDLLLNIEQMVIRNKGQCFTSDVKKGLKFQELFQQPKTLTEEEWNKREDELIQRMIKACWINYDAEDFKPSKHKQARSFDLNYPNFNEDTPSEAESGITLGPQVKVSEWLKREERWRYTSSSGYGTESIAPSYSEKRELVQQNLKIDDFIQINDQKLTEIQKHPKNIKALLVCKRRNSI